MILKIGEENQGRLREELMPKAGFEERTLDCHVESPGPVLIGFTLRFVVLLPLVNHGSDGCPACCPSSLSPDFFLVYLIQNQMTSCCFAYIACILVDPCRMRLLIPL